MNTKIGYKTAGNARKRRRRRRNRIRFIMAVVLVSSFLLMSAGQAIGKNLIKLDTLTDKSLEMIEVPEIHQNQEAVAVKNGINANNGTSSVGVDWKLILVNPWNALPADYEVSLTQLQNGHSVDQRCYTDLQAMMDDCRAAGLSPVICSSYRSQQKQETLYNQKLNSLIAKGYTPEEAKVEGGKAVAVPGTSEHQLGLAVDIVDLSNQNLDKSQEDTAVQKWLMKNSWKYGFILRYPNDKSDVTGIIYEPWHYRYVGKEAAKEIFEQGICLEEYA